MSLSKLRQCYEPLIKHMACVLHDVPTHELRLHVKRYKGVVSVSLTNAPSQTDSNAKVTVVFSGSGSSLDQAVQNIYDAGSAIIRSRIAMDLKDQRTVNSESESARALSPVECSIQVDCIGCFDKTIKTSSPLLADHIMFIAVRYCRDRLKKHESSFRANLTHVRKQHAMALFRQSMGDIGALGNALPGTDEPIFVVVVRQLHTEVGPISALSTLGDDWEFCSSSS